ncbi:anacyclamide/piricyclamide family prenylated cyclic peptide [Planktothrix agardhii]|jgi:prenylated cyclic peptide (anacyclamide/piricyclamide family)|uniref:anacyclamide/piricyclamide family prenylated cyclic peptide n=1 Tax=Planktothrix agardhii TaxID=1160 RepID=UPI000DBB7288|nr:anacyclamide/piricyclamide family prenylated cyclic peptide [Planktothrix agardhii]MCF3606064.1 DUF5840 family protein [Planktothrix agardhii 1033]BBD55889.1 hypothetical protein NIES204_32080 [Planktothrix agardhii NIES-204]CAD5956456.1 Cyanobactin peptide [Planktothrix agardhii]
MTKKNLKPQQAAPVQREINTTSSMGRDGAIAPSEWTRDNEGNMLWVRKDYYGNVIG